MTDTTTLIANAQAEARTLRNNAVQLDEENERLRAEIERLQRLVIEHIVFNGMNSSPCCVCGHNGPGYYQPDTHPCAATWHKCHNPQWHDPQERDND